MKSRRSFLLIFISMFCLLILACTPEPKLSHLADDAVILAFGDSLTYGTGAAPGGSYPEVLSKLVRRHIVNAGIPGEVTEEGLTRLPKVLDQVKPDLLILCHGGNDLIRRLDHRQIERNLTAMVRLARDRGIAVVLIAVPEPGFLLKPPDLYEDVATKQNIPVENQILEDVLSDRTLKSDYIHPNTAGYRQMADAVRDLLRRSGAVD